jgi:hypothetical protein
MSAKNAKAIRRGVKKEVEKNRIEVINKFLKDATLWSFRMRFGVAWCLLRGKEVKVVKEDKK